MAVINGEELILGRLASIVSERLLKGESIQIVNAQKLVITGSKTDVLKRFETKINLRVKGNPEKGPKMSRRTDLFVKRSIRGMLPYKSKRGKDAMKRLRVFTGIPKNLAAIKAENIEKIKHKGSKKFLYVEEISKLLGAQ